MVGLSTPNLSKSTARSSDLKEKNIYKETEQVMAMMKTNGNRKVDLSYIQEH